MTRHAPIADQAAIARVARVAEQLGPPWVVEVDGNVIRLVRGDPKTQKARVAPVKAIVL